MAIEIGPTLRKRRERARLTQQELIDHTRMDRSSSYISALETGRSSPTLIELEQLARYFRVSVIELLEEASGESVRRGGSSATEEPAGDDRVERFFNALTEGDQELALEFMQLLARHSARSGSRR